MASNSHKLRSQNKPKCIKCGNIARSRCDYQSCKKCCAEAENPCAVHALKANATISVKTPTSVPSFDQPSTEPSPIGTTGGKAYLYELYNTFVQFNNLQSLCSRRPPTRKEALAINEGRFRKLKEHKVRIIENENEAFDRYMENIALLEEVLDVNNKPEKLTNDMPVELCNKTMLSALSIRQRSNPIRSENLRKRVQEIVDQGLKKLKKTELNICENEPNDQNDLVTKAGRLSSMNDLMDRLSKARNEEDLKSCLQIKSDLFGEHGAKTLMQKGDAEVSNAEIGEEVQELSDYLPPKWMNTGNVDQDALVRIDSQFSSPEGIELL